jgi:hypothetical protein
MMVLKCTFFMFNVYFIYTDEELRWYEPCTSNFCGLQEAIAQMKNACMKRLKIASDTLSTGFWNFTLNRFKKEISRIIKLKYSGDDLYIDSFYECPVLKDE